MGGGVAAEMSARLDLPTWPPSQLFVGEGSTEVSFLVTSFEVAALDKERELLITVSWQ